MIGNIENIFIVDPVVRHEEKIEFYNFFKTNCKNCFPTFLNVNYTVPPLLVRSVTKNVGGRQGAHRQVWLEFSSSLDMVQANSKYANMHKAEILQYIYDRAGGSYQRLINTIKSFNEEIQNVEIQFNKVKYGYKENFNERGDILNYG